MRLLFLLIDAYTWIILIRALISWVSPDPRNQLVQVLRKLTEPVLAPLRALAPPEKLGGIDVSPLIAIVLLQIFRRLLVSMLLGF